MWFKPVTIQRKSKGYTLMEMMITIAIMAVAIALAAPPLQNFINSNKMTTTTNKLVSAIILAKNEAVTRRATVNISGNGDGSGWVVAIVPLTTSTVIPIASYTLDAGMTLRIDNSDARNNGISFSPNGFRDLTTGTSPTATQFTVCSADTSNIRIVNVSVAGTTSVTKSTSDCPSPPS